MEWLEWLSSPYTLLFLFIIAVLSFLKDLFIDIFDLRARFREWWPLWSKKRLEQNLEKKLRRREVLDRCRNDVGYLIAFIVNDTAHQGIKFVAIFFSLVILSVIGVRFFDQPQIFSTFRDWIPFLLFLAILLLDQWSSYWYRFTNELMNPAMLPHQIEKLIEKGKSKGFLNEQEAESYLVELR